MRTKLAIAFVGAAIVTGAVVGTGQSAMTTHAKAKPIKPLAVVTTSALPGGMVATDDAVWIETAAGIQRIDPQTNAVVAKIAMPNGDGLGLAVGDGSVWAADFDSSVIRRVDPATNSVIATIVAGANPAVLTFANGSVWAANKRGGSVSRIDPKTNSVVATAKAGVVGPGGPQGIAYGFGAIWVAASNVNAVVRIDATTNRPTAQIKLPATAEACGTIAIARSVVWVSSCDNSPTVVAIDPRTNKVSQTVNVGGFANGAVVVNGKAWYSSAGTSPRLVRVEPDTKKPTAVRQLARSVKQPNAMLLAFGSLWLTDSESAKVLRFPAGVLK